MAVTIQLNWKLAQRQGALAKWLVADRGWRILNCYCKIEESSELVNLHDTTFVGVIGPLSLPDVPRFGVKQDEIVHVIGLVEFESAEVIVHAAIDSPEICVIYGKGATLVLIPDTVVYLP